VLVAGFRLPRLSFPNPQMPSRTTAAGDASARLAEGSPGAQLNNAEQSQTFEWLVRTGFVARGVTYGLVGALTLALAFGAGTDGTQTDQQGALALVARAPLGFVALIVIAAGFLAYAVWKFTQAIRGRGPEGGGGSEAGDRVVNAGGGVAYLLFCGLAVETLVGSGSSSGGSPKRAAGGVLSWPGGPWIVGAVALALIAGCIYQAYYALAEKFTGQAKTGQMDGSALKRYRVLGKIGLLSRAVVLTLIGYFLIKTALDYSPGSAVGVDGALARLHNQAYGPWLVGLVGIGLLIFAGFSLYEARYRRL
jgi:Domain of Unknown Function (DUF1206)